MSSDAPGGVPAGAHELHLIDAHGESLTVLLTYSSITVAGEPLSVCVLLDVTELRRLERDVLADLSGERGRLSQEVHEGIAQDLTGIGLLLSTVVGQSQSDVTTLAAMVRHVNELLIRARTLAGQLSPVQIAGGLSQPVMRLTEQFAASLGIKISCQCELGGLSLTLAQADHVYGIAHDCLRLAALEPSMCTIAVNLHGHGSLLTVAVATDGPVLPESPDESLDWGTVAYRARVMGGTARSDSLPAGGRRRVIAVPVSI